MEVAATSTCPPSLPSLPLDVIEAVGSRLPFKDRLRLASCCRGLWLREDIASSTALWGDVLVRRPSLLDGRHAALAAWLAKRRHGVVRLQLWCGGDEALRVAPVLHALDGGVLADLTISGCPQLGKAGEAAAALSAQHLAGLSRLVLEECALSSLPPTLSALPSLRVLWVPLNSPLGREGGAKLGAALRGLTQLTELSLRSCRLSQLPPELGSLTQLLALDVGSNHALGEAPASSGAAASTARDVPLSALQPVSRLTRLDLSWCRLQHVPGFLSTFASLADLALDVNGGLGEGGDRAFLPLQQGACSPLRRLGLSYCRLYALPSFLSDAPQLAELCLNSNMALGDGSLAQLRGCSMLTLLHIRECGLHAVPKELCDLPLAELDLSWNTQLGQGREAATFRALASLGALLTWLDLGKCFLERLPPQVSCLTALRHLGLWNNWSLGQHAWHGGEWHARFEGLERLTGLTDLGLGMCGLERVPKDVAALSHLAHLDLSNNRLGGGGQTALDPLVPLRCSLTYLNIQSCGLESVPVQLSALVSLVHLDFSGNEIPQAASAEGALQALHSLTQLTHLDITCCNLSPQLPGAS